MPELPEVEIVCRELNTKILNLKITGLEKSGLSLRKPIDIDDKDVNNSIILNVERKAKFCLISLSNNNYIVIHLGMSGQLIYNISFRNIDYPKHTHFKLFFNNGAVLYYVDPRRFGLINVITSNQIKNHSIFKNMGVEPFSKDFTAEYLYNKLCKKNIPIKPAIMDNSIVVGVGNIYASESLFMSKIDPRRKSRSLDINDCNILLENIKIILSNAIEKGGSSLKDYVNTNGESGYFQNNFSVYSKNGQECFVCKNIITKIYQAGRSTFFCDKCQK